MSRFLNHDAATKAWDDAYALKNREPRVVAVPAHYWLAALPAIILCFGLLIIWPNPVAFNAR